MRNQPTLFGSRRIANIDRNILCRYCESARWSVMVGETVQAIAIVRIV